MTAYLADPLTAACSYCGNPAGMRCGTEPVVPGGSCGVARKPHAPRVKLALILAAHADAALDEHLPRLGPCGICGTQGLDQRHRVVDAIAGAVEAGEGEDCIAADYVLPLAAVLAVEAWAKRWPGAWR